MLSHVRSRVTYANVVATLALVFAMSGGALAASHYIISSSKQIKPSALTEIKTKAKGATGSAGPAGPQGPAGTTGKTGETGESGKTGETGKTGPEGSPWTDGGTLPSGKTETGSWSIGETPAEVNPGLGAISFPIPLSTTLTKEQVHYIKKNGTVPPGCTGGTAVNPIAEKGNLCIYAASESTEPGKREFNVLAIILPGDNGATEGAGKTGALIDASVEAEGQAYGTWAVTAP